MKLENEISRLSREDADIQRSVDALQARVDQLYQQRSLDQRHNEQLQAAYSHLTLDYMAQLKVTTLGLQNTAFKNVSCFIIQAVVSPKLLWLLK